jgi:hypothetical protein
MNIETSILAILKTQLERYVLWANDNTIAIPHCYYRLNPVSYPPICNLRANAVFSIAEK